MIRCTDNPAAGTPTLIIADNRGLTVRTLQYNRQAITQTPEALITRSNATDNGLISSQWDPRLYENWINDAGVKANQVAQTSLMGQTLRSDSVDSGWKSTLYDAEGRAVWQIDNNQTIKRQDFDLNGRVTACMVQLNTAAERVTERYYYGDTDSQTVTPQNSNLRGRMVRHYHGAGKTVVEGYTLSGGVVSAAASFLASAEQQSDWYGDDEAVWLTALADETWTTSWMLNAQGSVVMQTDACNNQQRFYYDETGVLCASNVTQPGQPAKEILTSITYSAAGKRLLELAGSGVQTTWNYDEQDQRLVSVITSRRDGIQLQNIIYGYDPVGNVLSINDTTVPVSYFRNQAAPGKTEYLYDALYQLVSATGRENAGISPQTSSLPDVIPDVNNLVPYTRSYQYDNAGNLKQFTHLGACSYNRVMAIAPGSNRSVLNTSGNVTPAQVESYFDPNGNLQQLQPGIPLIWDGYNQLQYVVSVDRGGAMDQNDREVYQYCHGNRVRKQSRILTNSDNNIWQVNDIFYLPGLEIRQTYIDDNGNRQPITEELHCLKINDSSRAEIRVMNWQIGLPPDIEPNQIRYSLNNLIGSVNIELDGNGNVLSREEYYPFGGTAVLVGNSSEVKYKYIRYSGKERDNSGLYYYGYRYYAPWLLRWVNSDPGGDIDGLNRYRMVRNNPVSYFDSCGLQPEGMPPLSKKQEWYFMGDYKKDLAALGVSENEINSLTYNDVNFKMPFNGGPETYDSLLNDAITIGSHVKSLFSFGGRQGGFELTMALRHEAYQEKGYGKGAWHHLDSDPDTEEKRRFQAAIYLDAQSASVHKATKFTPVSVNVNEISKKLEKITKGKEPRYVTLDINAMSNPMWDVIYKKGVFSADSMVFLITREWLKSEYCHQEFGWFLEAREAGHPIKGLFVLFPNTQEWFEAKFSGPAHLRDEENISFKQVGGNEQKLMRIGSARLNGVKMKFWPNYQYALTTHESRHITQFIASAGRA